MRVLHGFGADLRLAARRLLATPAFTLFAIASLAIGIGVTTIVYSIVDSIFWRTLAVDAPSRIVVLAVAADGRYSRTSVSTADFDDLRASLHGLQLTAIAGSSVSAALPNRARRVVVEGVDGAYFGSVGVRTSLGRGIQPDDEREARRVVVLSHGLWQRSFGGDPAVVGTAVRLAGIPFEIIGVAAAPFQGIAWGPEGTSIWVPSTCTDELMPPQIAAALARSPNARRWYVVGRLGSDTNIEAVNTQLAQLSAELDRIRPQRTNAVGQTIRPRRWRVVTIDEMSEDNTGFRIAWVIVGLAGLVLVVACTNLSNLVLARGIMRHHEVAVRQALGAPRVRLIREQVSESLIIALLGGIASYIVLVWLQNFVTTDFAMDRHFTLTIEPSIHSGTLAMAAGAMVLALVVFGLEPAIQLTKRSELRNELTAAAGSVGLPRVRRHRFLLRWQVAISAGFFILATMFVRYTVQQITHDPGVRLGGLAVADVDFQLRGWDEPRVRREIDRLIEASRQEPRLGSIAVSSGLPFGTSNPVAELTVPGGVTQKGVRVIAATPNIFTMLGVPILQGRPFDRRDAAQSRPAVVLNERAALALFGTVSAVAREVSIDGFSGSAKDDAPRLATVVGIARDTDSRYLSERRLPTMYLSLAHHYSPRLTLTGRSASAGTATGALEQLIRTTNPEISVDSVAEASQILVGPYVFLRAAGLVTLGLGFLTLLLAMVGLFGIQSHIVTHRTREIGVRMAFGASGGRIKAMVLRDGYKPVLQGLAMGVFIGLTGRAIVRAYLDANVSLLDPWMFFVVPVPLVLAALFACWMPARRASRVEPMVALRHL